MLQKFYRTSMKTNSKKIPHPSSERKVSPITGRGVRDAQTSRKKRTLVEEDYGQDFKNDLVSDSEDYGGSVMQSLHKRITPQKSPKTIGASVPPPIPNKAPHHETAGVSFPTSGDSQGKHILTYLFMLLFRLLPCVPFPASSRPVVFHHSPVIERKLCAPFFLYMMHKDKQH
jgi:hypothetical protein